MFWPSKMGIHPNPSSPLVHGACLVRKHGIHTAYLKCMDSFKQSDTKLTYWTSITKQNNCIQSHSHAQVQDHEHTYPHTHVCTSMTGTPNRSEMTNRKVWEEVRCCGSRRESRRAPGSCNSGLGRRGRGSQTQSVAITKDSFTQIQDSAVVVQY